MAAVGSIAKWYVAKLKAYPLLTNVSSAFVLMTTGDLLAQNMEASKKRSNAQHHLSVTVIDKKNGGDSSSHVSLDFEGAIMGTSSVSMTVESLASTTIESIAESISIWDSTRTMTMAAWAVCVYTPFYVSLYRLYDRYLPKQTPASIATRMFLSFLTSAPVNAAFYTYGAAAHHTIEWLGQKTKLRKELEEMGLDSFSAYQAASSIPYPEEAFWAQAKHKLETELPNTVVTSGTCWIPINLFTFTMVPSHLRPISLMFFSAFWNCYLSLSQHREAHHSTDKESSDESSIALSS